MSHLFHAIFRLTPSPQFGRPVQGPRGESNTNTTIKLYQLHKSWNEENF